MTLGLLALLLASFIGGGVNPVLVKLGVTEIPPVTFSALRFLIATVVFAPFFIAQKIKLTRRDIFVLCLASIPLAGNIAFFSIGIQYTTTIISQVFYAAGSLVVAILAFLFLKERFSHNKIIGLALATLGAFFLIYKSATTGEVLTFGTLLGNVIILFAVCCYATYIIVSKKVTKTRSFVAMSFFNFLVTGLLLAFILPIELKIRPFVVEDITTTGIIAVFGTAIVSSVIYYFLIQFGIKRAGVFYTSLFHYTGPFFTAVAAIPILGERPTADLVAGGVLIMLGVFVATTYNQLKNRRKFMLQ